ncbi:hypothetical protein ABZ133_001810 [Listeria monocytogenes]|nr:hypothetical protein [Listeria monocytogenes]EEO1169532.1 hypothetical protein [Listeria monocytogenes]EJQ6734374.1 hypothetical protein [Listeria monocytogenes]
MRKTVRKMITRIKAITFDFRARLTAESFTEIFIKYIEKIIPSVHKKMIM